MKNNKTLKKIFKIFVIGFILISCIYVLYFYNINTIENFITNNCSKCKVNPSSGNCKPIYDISYSWSGNMLIINNIDTSNVLCKWESDCSYNEMGNNMATQEERIRITNAQLASSPNNSYFYW